MILMAALAIGMTASTQAQEMKKRDGRHNISPEQRAEKQTEKMAKSLELNAQQKQQVLELNKESAKSLKQTNEDRKAKLKILRAQREEKLKSILTPVQMEKYQAQKAERKKKMMEHRAMKQKGSKTQPANEMRYDK